MTVLPVDFPAPPQEQVAPVLEAGLGTALRARVLRQDYVPVEHSEMSPESVKWSSAPWARPPRRESIGWMFLLGIALSLRASRNIAASCVPDWPAGPMATSALQELAGNRIGPPRDRLFRTTRRNQTA